MVWGLRLLCFGSWFGLLRVLGVAIVCGFCGVSFGFPFMLLLLVGGLAVFLVFGIVVLSYLEVDCGVLLICAFIHVLFVVLLL